MKRNCLKIFNLTLLVSIFISSCSLNKNHNSISIIDSISESPSNSDEESIISEYISSSDENSDIESISEYISEDSTLISEEESITSVDIEQQRIDYLNSLTFGKSIKYANKVKNQIKSHYSNGNKSQYLLGNSHIEINYDCEGEQKLPLSVKNPNNNGIYLENTLNPYVVCDGNKYYSSNSDVKARDNIYKYGYYYYYSHMTDQLFGSIKASTDLLANSYDVFDKGLLSFYRTSDIENLNFTKEELNFNIKSTYDPYFVMSVNYLASDYNCVYLRLKTNASKRAQLFVGSSTAGISAATSISFNVKNDGEYHDYFIRMQSIPNYEETIKQLRLDIGSDLGEYISITDFKVVNVNAKYLDFTLDRGFHIYGDKMYEHDRIAVTQDDTFIDDFGYEIKIKKSSVCTFKKWDDQNFNDGNKSFNINNVKAIAFDINDVGVIGFMLPFDKPYNLSLTVDDTYYIVNLKMNLENHQYSKNTILDFGVRIYSDSEHKYTNFENELYIESHPLSIDLINNDYDSKVVGYDSLRGSYIYTTKPSNFNRSYYEYPQEHITINGTIKSHDNRKIYVCGATYTSGSLESATLLDQNSQILPIQVEVAKNFSYEMEEPLFDPTDALFGEAIFPLEFESEEKLDFKLIHLYQKWGQADLKQLSSIQFTTPYYHLSSGTTETNCIATESNNFLPDFRSMSAPLWPGQPQHTSYGVNNFLNYVDSDGNIIKGVHKVDTIDSSGPVYADLDLNYISSDGKISAQYRHLEMPQKDENRTYYEVDYEINDDIYINDFAKDFAIFNSNSRSLTYKKIGYIDINNNHVHKDIDINNNNDEVIILGDNAPFFDLYDADSDDYVNLAIMVKDFDIKISGEFITPNFVIENRLVGQLNYVDLSLNLKEVHLKKGDYIRVNMILVPWGSQESVNDDNVWNLRYNTLLSPYNLTSYEGDIVFDPYLPKLSVNEETQKAEFNIKNGKDWAAIRIYGFNKLGRPFIEEKINGEWQEYKYNYYDYDGYNVYFENDNTYSYAFAVFMNSDNNQNYDSRTFRVSII